MENNMPEAATSFWRNQKDRQDPLSFNTIFFILSFWIMTVMTIINGNVYVAGLSFTLYPSVFLVGMSLLVRRKWIVTTTNVLVVLLLISATISTVRSDIVSASHTTHMNLIFSMVAFILVSTVRYSDRMFRSILMFYFRFTLCICIIMCINSVISYGIAVNGRVSITYFGITKDVNYLTAFLVPGYCYYMYTALIGKRQKSMMAAVVMFVAIFLSGSRSVFLSAVIVTALVLGKIVLSKGSSAQKTTLIIVIIAVIALLYILLMNSALFSRMTTMEGYEENARWKIWGYAMEAFTRNPLWGSGTTSGGYFSLLSTRWITHNCFLDILTGQGIVGSIIILAVFASIIKVKKSNALFMTCFMITSFMPLFFVNGYECATFWMPMLFCKLISDKCKEKDHILDLI